MNLSLFGWSNYIFKYLSGTQFFKIIFYIDYIKLQQGHYDEKCI